MIAAWDTPKQLLELAETLMGTAWRMVESQEQVATTKVVRTLDQQSILEGLLDESKPPHNPAIKGRHYLLSTPFRYPPLRHGSRFGSRTERSIMYAGKTLMATLTEVAYYRCVLLADMDENTSRISSSHTLFTFRYKGQGLRLQDPPFSADEATLRHVSDYSETQHAGRLMREAELELFEYLSARSPEKATCIGIISPDAVVGKQPKNQEPWLCEVDRTMVRFREPNKAAVIHLPIDIFLINGVLPRPSL